VQEHGEVESRNGLVEDELHLDYEGLVAREHGRERARSIEYPDELERSGQARRAGEGPLVRTRGARGQVGAHDFLRRPVRGDLPSVEPDRRPA
jgi:hypothetical protein